METKVSMQLTSRARQHRKALAAFMARRRLHGFAKQVSAQTCCLLKAAHLFEVTFSHAHRAAFMKQILHTGCSIKHFACSHQSWPSRSCSRSDLLASKSEESVLLSYGRAACYSHHVCKSGSLPVAEKFWSAVEAWRLGTCSAASCTLRNHIKALHKDTAAFASPSA